MDLPLFFGLAAGDALPDCPQEIEPPEAEIGEQLFSFYFVQNGPFSIVDSREIGISIEDGLLDALEI